MVKVGFGYFLPQINADEYRCIFVWKDRSRKAYFGWFPFKWKNEWKQSFDALRGDGRLFVAPILQTLILNRSPKEAIDWADKVASWNFDRIIPCHFDSPISANPRQFRQAFAFLEKNPSVADSLFGTSSQFLPQSDFKLLKELEVILNKMGVTPPAKEKV
ncbi:DUF4336 domain-containing protein [Argonema antarcticum]|uniref:DUF4336 domain-containing protein n=1 Tax=Argonema antarcticum TaxID=2942763 RepID=UPI003083F424